MIVLLVAAVVIVIVAAIALAVVIFRQPAVPATPPAPAEPPIADLTAEREQAESVGAELLSRRVELDARRGALQGDASIEREFDRLFEQLQSGEISEEQFEQEKIRLLGG
jgi:hypothetical protein